MVDADHQVLFPAGRQTFSLDKHSVRVALFRPQINRLESERRTRLHVRDAVPDHPNMLPRNIGVKPHGLLQEAGFGFPATAAVLRTMKADKGSIDLPALRSGQF